VLQISSYWLNGQALEIDLLPSMPGLECLSAEKNGRELSSALSEHLPRRFARSWSGRNAPPLPLNRYSSQQLADLDRRLHAWQVQPAGTEGFSRAEVTVGGVDTNALSSKTMEARRVPGLFFVGE